MPLAAIPVALTSSSAPDRVPTDRMKFSELYVISSLGFVGAFTIGLANGAMRGLIPLAGIRFGLSKASVATLMSLIVLGGVVFQWPTGWLSDRMDRRKVIALTSLMLLASSVALYFVAMRSQNLLFAISFVFGGMSLVLYPLCAAHTNNRVDSGDRIQAIATLLLLLGVGAAIGPLLGALTMDWFGSRSVFLFIAGVLALFLVFALFRIYDGEAVPTEDRSRFEPVILDPRVEVDEPRMSV